MMRLEGKYAVLIPKITIIPEYLCIALERVAPEFLRKYVGDNINIQMDAFRWLELEYHINPDTQRYIADSVKIMQQGIDAENAEIEAIRELKKYMLNKMLRVDYEDGGRRRE